MRKRGPMRHSKTLQDAILVELVVRLRRHVAAYQALDHLGQVFGKGAGIGENAAIGIGYD